MQEVYFYVEQTVYSPEFGEGKVKNIDQEANDCVLVIFKDLIFRSFTFKGYRNGVLSLFQQPINLPTNKPIIRIKKGDLIWVREFPNTQWECRYFSHFTDFSRTKVACFINQQKDGDLKEWERWSEFENIPF